MAGESPDKSEQQKSSGTARSESDPRLAVFREPSADDAAAGSGETDTATAVFRTDAVAGAGEVAKEAKDAKSDTATAVFRAMPSGDGEGAGAARALRPVRLLRPVTVRGRRARTRMRTRTRAPRALRAL